MYPSDYLVLNEAKRVFLESELKRITGNSLGFLLKRIQRRRLSRPMLATKNSEFGVSEDHFAGEPYLLVFTRYAKTREPVAVMVSCSERSYFEIRALAFESIYSGSVFFGTLVLEQEPQKMARQLFWVTDCLALRNRDFTQVPFLQRYETLVSLFDLGDRDILEDPRNWLGIAHSLVKDHEKIVCDGNQFALQFRPEPLFHGRDLPILWRRSKSRHGIVIRNLDSESFEVRFWQPRPTLCLGYEIPSQRLFFMNGSQRNYGDDQGLFLSAGLPPLPFCVGNITESFSQELASLNRASLVLEFQVHWPSESALLQFFASLKDLRKQVAAAEACRVPEFPVVLMEPLRLCQCKTNPDSARQVMETVALFLQKPVTIQELASFLHHEAIN